MAIATRNPATGVTVEEFEEHSGEQVEARLAAAAAAFSRYRLTSFAERATMMTRAAGILDAEAGALGELVTTEMGKTVREARAEVAKCSTACRYFAHHSEAFLAAEPTDPAGVGAVAAYAFYQPIGVVLAVMPWNFPMWQALRFAVPALMAGNVGLLKHASNVPRTALYIEDLFRRAGFAEGTFQTLLVGSEQVGRILRDDRVAAATLTGSNQAGEAVASVAGSVTKATVLELGGSDPFVVMASADLRRAARVGARARCQNNGQSCIAAKRFVVQRDVAGEFTSMFLAEMQALRVGDPLDDGTDVGPLATEAGRSGVEELVADAVDHGAEVLCGGRRLPGPGWWYPPTVIRGVTPAMRIYREEVFGPVAALFTVADADEAIRLANATPFGLGSSYWTGDESEKRRFIRDSAAGLVFVNGMTASYPQLPFGGVKQSGYGRELSAHGIRAFCNLKTVWVGSDL